MAVVPRVINRRRGRLRAPGEWHDGKAWPFGSPGAARDMVTGPSHVPDVPSGAL